MSFHITSNSPIKNLLLFLLCKIGLVQLHAKTSKMACFRLYTILSSVPSTSCIPIGIHIHSSTVTVNILY